MGSNHRTHGTKNGKVVVILKHSRESGTDKKIVCVCVDFKSVVVVVCESKFFFFR